MNDIFCMASPIGEMQFSTEDGKIRTLTILERGDPLSPQDKALSGTGLIKAREQLGRYFAGTLQEFDLPIDFSDYSTFAVAVLHALQTVPFGTTVSYGELAAMAGHPGAARAVGRVVGANRTPILIPCHRVIGSSGKLVGYSAAGGLETKRWLLEFEQKFKV